MGIKSQGGAYTPTFNWRFGSTGKDAAINVVPTPVTPMEATGGTTYTFTQPGGNYKAHVFTASGSFVVSTWGPSVVDVLVVGAGGGGGAGGPGGSAGGGGAGTVIHAPGHDLSPDAPPTSGPHTFPIVIGAGGAGGSAPTGQGSQGGASEFKDGPAAPSIIIKSSGGGYGAFGTNNGGNGGSGGGGGRPSGTEGNTTGMAECAKPEAATMYGSNGSGNPGGSPGATAGGGGGAGQHGGTPGSGGGGDGVQINIVPYTTFEPGDGRVGSAIPAPVGASGYYWGGGGSGPNGGIRGGYGGGGGDQPDSPTDKNGLYGWNEGAKPGPAVASNAGANTGGGGGGAGGSSNNGGTGGPGMVIIRYLV